MRPPFDETLAGANLDLTTIEESLRYSLDKSLGALHAVELVISHWRTTDDASIAYAADKRAAIRDYCRQIKMCLAQLAAYKMENMPKVRMPDWAPRPTNRIEQLVHAATRERTVDSIYTLMRAIGELQNCVSMLWPYRHWLESIARDMRRINPGLSTESEPNNVAHAVTALVSEVIVRRKENRRQ